MYKYIYIYIYLPCRQHHSWARQSAPASQRFVSRCDWSLSSKIRSGEFHQPWPVGGQFECDFWGPANFNCRWPGAFAVEFCYKTSLIDLDPDRLTASYLEVWLHGTCRNLIARLWDCPGIEHRRGKSSMIASCINVHLVLQYHVSQPILIHLLPLHKQVPMAITTRGKSLEVADSVAGGRAVPKRSLFEALLPPRRGCALSDDCIGEL